MNKADELRWQKDIAKDPIREDNMDESRLIELIKKVDKEVRNGSR